MTTISKTDIAEIMGMIGAAFPNFAPSKETIALYRQLLSDIPLDLLHAATLHTISQADRKFAPSVGEIRGAAGEIMRSVSKIPSSYEAWEEVRLAMVEVGSYGTPKFSHPLVAKAVSVIGWRDMCLSENTVADRSRFIQAYEQLEQRAMRDGIMLPEVKKYIGAGQAKALDAGAQMKALASKLSR